MSALRIAAFAVRRRRLAPLSWGVPLGLLGAMVTAVFPSIRGSAQLDQLLESYPEALKQAFGISAQTYASIQGYLAAELFNLIAPLAICWFAIHALAGAICSAERRGGLDVILAAPITRRQFAAGWLAGTVTSLVGILLAFGVLLELAATAAGAGLPILDLAAGAANLIPLTLFFAGVTILLAGITDRTMVVTGTATGLLVAMYFVQVLGGLSDTVRSVDWLSAFHYYGSAIEDGIDPLRFGGLAAGGLALAAVGATLLERRDIRS